MKKIVLILILFFSCSIPVYAEEYTSEEFYSSTGADNLYSGDMLEENGISFDNPESISELTPSKIWEIVKAYVIEKITQPEKTFVSVLMIIIISSLIDGIGGTVKNRNYSKIFEVICILSSVLIIFEPVCNCFDMVSDALSDGAEFMLSFVPVFSGLAAACGNVTAATGYSGAVLGFSNIATEISNKVFLPLLSMCLAAAIVDSCCDGISLKGIVSGCKKITVWGIGLVMTVFTGLLSIQSMVSSSADSVASKAAKYVISNSIPIVGSAASDAYSTVKGSIILLKNGVGGIGIAALAVMLLAPVIHILIYKVLFFLLGVISDIFGSGKICRLFENINSILSAAVSILICFSLMFIISTGIIMSVCSSMV